MVRALDDSCTVCVRVSAGQGDGHGALVLCLFFACSWSSKSLSPGSFWIAQSENMNFNLSIFPDPLLVPSC